MADSTNLTNNTPAHSSNPATVSSEALAASGASADQGDQPTSKEERQENQQAAPREFQAPAYTTGQQAFAHDPNHYQNEVAGASRGEFGRQSDLGTTQGGYGNELSRGDATYAGTQATPAATTGYVGERQQRPGGFAETDNGSFGSQPVGAAVPRESAVGPDFANDNAAPKGPDSGYAENYGTSSLGGGNAGSAQPISDQRNQHEDYLPNRPEGGPKGLHTGVAASNSSQGTDEADATPTSGSRSGYDAAGAPDAQGGTQSGFGSKGGSYNDEYDSASPSNQEEGSPARGNYSREEGAQNYSGASDDRTKPSNSPDYGPAPGRTSTPD